MVAPSIVGSNVHLIDLTYFPFPLVCDPRKLTDDSLLGRAGGPGGGVGLPARRGVVLVRAQLNLGSDPRRRPVDLRELN